MIAYSILMFAIAVLFLVFGIAIYKENTKLIHDYHQIHIKESERQEYSFALFYKKTKPTFQKWTLSAG